MSVETWIREGDDIRPWCELVAEVVGYSFDDLDWHAIAVGTNRADRHNDIWFDYSFEGTETIRFRMSYDIWHDKLAIIYDAPAHIQPAINLASSVIQRFKLVPRK